jgi:hypothetical protein
MEVDTAGQPIDPELTGNRQIPNFHLFHSSHCLSLTSSAICVRHACQSFGSFWKTLSSELERPPLLGNGLPDDDSISLPARHSGL